MFTARDQLRSFIDRIEVLEAEKRTAAEKTRKTILSADIRDVYAEAKMEGFCAKSMRQLITARRKGAEPAAEPNTVLAMYASAIDAPTQTA